MSTNAHPILDFESAPVRPEGLPGRAHDIPEKAPLYENEKDEKNDMALTQQTSVTPIESLDDEDYEGKPTEEEMLTLRKVPGTMPWTAVAMCLIELSERASYYGCVQLFNNFVRAPLPAGGPGTGAVPKGPAGDNLTAGALGLGSQVATAVTQSFTFLAYVFPILGGIVSDVWWGRFRTLCVGTGVGAFAHVLLVVPAIPSVIASGNALAPFLISIYILSGAAGFIKPTLAPMLCDQSPVKRSTIKVLKSGERVILSPQVTVQRYLLVFYWAINVGAFFGLATSYAAYNVGFWLAFLTPGIFYMLMPLVLWVCYKRLVRFAPQGSVVLEAFKACRSLFKDGNSANLFKRGNAFWENARPSAIASRGGDLSGVTWDDKFIDDLQRTMAACKVFLLYAREHAMPILERLLILRHIYSIPIFNLANSGLGNSVNAMSSAMTLGGVPNDLIQNWNALTIVCCAPLINYGLYPAFSKMGYPISPMWRMTIGFTLGGLNMIYGGVLQTRVYATSPCGKYATSECALGVSPISLWLQVPLFSLPALGEIFVNVTSYELAYTRAPPRMKGLVYAFCLFTTAISSAIGLACSAAVTDPYLVEPYWVLAALSLACAVSFPLLFKGLDKEVNFFDPSLASIKQDKAEVDVEETREKR